MSASVLLIDPKYPHNVGNVLRACSVLGATRLGWTGGRVDAAGRLPREERMRAYQNIQWGRWPKMLDALIELGVTPVCVEVWPTGEPLPTFVHPENALYVFGPEDGSVPKGVRTACHRFVRIPGIRPRQPSCLNLAAAVNVVLYDRIAKAWVDADLGATAAAGALA